MAQDFSFPDWGDNLQDPPDWTFNVTAWEFLMRWPPFLPSTEGKQMLASKSEMRRWFERNSVHVNGQPAKMDTIVTELDNIVLHPKGNKRTTLN